MITTHDPTTGQLDPSSRTRPAGWIAVVDPSPEEREKLIELGVPQGLIRDALDTDEMSRVHHHATGAKLFVLRVPAAVRADAEVVPLGVVTLPDGRVVTISGRDTGIPEMMILAEGEEALSPTTFALRLSGHVAERFVRALRAIEDEISRLEGKLKEALENDEILGLLEQQKRLVHLVTALTANQIVLERALEDARLQLSDAERVLVEDVLVETHQAATMARTQKELLGETMDALATVVSNNLNVAMKKLASLTLMVSLPALAAGLYGMNVPLPFAHQPWAFLGVLGASGLSMVALGAYLRAHRWL